MRPTWLLPIYSLLFGAVTAQVTKADDLDDPRFIGYYIGPDQTERLTATTDWVTSGSFAGDCPNDPCTFATNCVGNVLTFNNGQTAKCASGNSCVTMSIFQSFPNGRPLVSNIFCRGGWQAYTVYRQLAAETTSSEEETPKATGTTSTTSSAEATSDPQNEGDDESNDEDPLEDGEETSSGGSNAWIAGAVIGPLAAVCAAVAAFVWMRKRKGAQQSAKAGAASLEDGSAPKDGSEPPPVYMLHTNEKPIELPTEQQFVAELPASTRY